MNALSSLLLSALIASAPAKPGAPVTKRVPVTDTYHGVVVTDVYRWLEDWEDPAVKAWSRAQNAAARAVLDALPGREQLRARVEAILGEKSPSFWGVAQRGEMTFAIESQPPKQQPFLIVTTDLDDLSKAKVVFDPARADASGQLHMDWYQPSPDGKLVALSLSSGGTESGDVHIIEVETGKEVFEVIPRVNSGTAGGDLAWAKDGKGFYYTRHQSAAERQADGPGDHPYQQLYFHALGEDPSADRFELGEDFPAIAEIQVAVDARSGRVLATVQEGDGGKFAHYLKAPGGSWQQLSRFGDGTIEVLFGPQDDLYVVAINGSPRGRLLKVPVATPNVSKGTVVVPEHATDTIVTDFWGSGGVVVTQHRVYITYQLGGPTAVRAFDLDGHAVAAPKTLPVSAVSGLVRVGDDDLLFYNRSFLQPGAIYHFDAKANATKKTALAARSSVRFDDVEVVREFATSQDGTQVPVNILMRRGQQRDGKSAAVVTGYGGYGVNLTPRYNPLLRLLLDHGVVFAVANLRGGGEYGEQWHLQGNLTHKQNVFDDFIAVLEHMIARGYTSKARLAITGGSNGGLLMGATLTQRPELAHVVVSHVGIYDMLRVELSPNGAFNVTEFGSVKDPAQFKALWRYSPYHNVVRGLPYPHVLFLTGANDPRVDPMQSRKMTAMLQWATAGTDTQILLRTSDNSGHGLGTALSERIAQQVDVHAFLFHHLGIDATQETP